jgi:hypothetical protein
MIVDNFHMFGLVESKLEYKLGDYKVDRKKNKID